LGVNTNNLAATRLPLFPLNTQIKEGRLLIGGFSVEELAQEFGTPLYLYDQSTLDDALAQYRAALQAEYPAQSDLTYAGKAFLSLAMAQWAARRGLMIDCTGAGEITIAVAAGAMPEQLLVHGVSKSWEDLQAAVAHAGTLVVDHLGELERLIELNKNSSRLNFPDLWLRLRPGMAVETHSYTQTGQDDSKFGLSALEFLQALEKAQKAGLRVMGLHFHQGSHFHDPTPIAPALELALDLIVETRQSLGWMPQTLCPGGGWGTPYHEDDLPHQTIGEYVRFVAQHLIRGCRERNLPLPRLHLEPGRSLVARAGVAVYRVEAVKRTATRRWLLLDGGMADNPRPALYRARYTALPVSQPERPATDAAWLAGPYCESGDVLIEALPMPEIYPGELLAVPVSGAYQLSMASNYNGARRPAVIWLKGGKVTLIRQRESLEDLYRRDLPLPS